MCFRIGFKSHLHLGSHKNIELDHFICFRIYTIVKRSSKYILEPSCTWELLSKDAKIILILGSNEIVLIED